MLLTVMNTRLTEQAPTLGARLASRSVNSVTRKFRCWPYLACIAATRDCTCKSPSPFKVQLASGGVPGATAATAPAPATAVVIDDLDLDDLCDMVNAGAGLHLVFSEGCACG